MIIKPIESREWTGETSNRVSRPFALLGTFDRPHAYLSRLHSFYSPVRPERPSPLLLPPSFSLSTDSLPSIGKPTHQSLVETLHIRFGFSRSIRDAAIARGAALCPNLRRPFRSHRPSPFLVRRRWLITGAPISPRGNDGDQHDGQV